MVVLAVRRHVTGCDAVGGRWPGTTRTGRGRPWLSSSCEVGAGPGRRRNRRAPRPRGGVPRLGRPQGDRPRRHLRRRPRLRRAAEGGRRRRRRVLPWLEIVLGLLLLAGIATRAVAVAAAGLLLVFVAGVTQAWARGLSIDCGCFGGGGVVDPGQTAYGRELLRDASFLLMAAMADRPAADARCAAPGQAEGEGLTWVERRATSAGGGRRQRRRGSRPSTGCRAPAAKDNRVKVGIIVAVVIVAVFAAIFVVLNRPWGSSEPRRRDLPGRGGRRGRHRRAADGSRHRRRLRRLPLPVLRAVRDPQPRRPHRRAERGPRQGQLPRAEHPRRPHDPARLLDAGRQRRAVRRPRRHLARLPRAAVRRAARRGQRGPDGGPARRRSAPSWAPAPAFTQCVEANGNAAAITAATEAAATNPALQTDGQFGTPTIAVGGRKIDVSDSDWLQTALAGS